MKTVKIKFCFFFGENGSKTMETTHTGTGYNEDEATGNAWMEMAKDNFARQIVCTTSKIIVLSTETI